MCDRDQSCYTAADTETSHSLNLLSLHIPSLRTEPCTGTLREGLRYLSESQVMRWEMHMQAHPGPEGALECQQAAGSQAKHLH